MLTPSQSIAAVAATTEATGQGRKKQSLILSV